MQVIDEITRTAIDIRHTVLAIVKQTPELLVFGYFTSEENIQEVVIYQNGGLATYRAYIPALKENLIYSNVRGKYMSKVNMPLEVQIRETAEMGQGGFPYTFDRKYEAVENFNLFYNRQVILRRASHLISKHLDYTFGLEFETSQGYVPQDICFRDGLIPLRDGSITGLEYSTVVMKGNRGICLLKQQINTLKKYTTFNKECSLHMHFGGFPIEPNALYRLYYLFRRLTPSIECIVPEYTFDSDKYKQTGKNYCKRLPTFRDFNDMYRGLVGSPYMGSLVQPHPRDVERRRKWNIPTRYYALNFINAMCYDVNKTVEFRFLRPTYNFNKIILWMYIFNAILKYAENIEDLNDYPYEITDVIYAIYPTDLANEIRDGIIKLGVLKRLQSRNDDLCGNDVYLEDKLFKGKVKY